MTLSLLILALAFQLIAIAILALTGGGTTAIAILAATSLATVVIIYRLAILPIRILARGSDMLRGQDFNSRLRLTGHDDTDRLARMFNDMMYSLNAERLRVRETNRYLDLLVESSPLGIINTNIDGRIDLVNPSAARLLGVEASEIMGKPREAIPGHIGEAIAALNPDESRTIDLRAGGSDDTILSLSCYSFIDRGFPRQTVFIEPMTNIIRSAERLAYGRIIRVMAHEINNSMGAVRSTLDILADTPAVASDPDLPPLLKSCGERTASLTSFIDSYARVARLPEPTPIATDVEEFLTDILPALRAVASDVYVDIDASGGSFLAPLDHIQIEQTMVNIVKNAAESIARAGREDGSVVIYVFPDRRTIIIADNGAGIPADVAPSLFTPFFSTKIGSAASGIGLTLTADILRNHGISFSLATDPADHLTRFTLRLPPV